MPITVRAVSLLAAAALAGCFYIPPPALSPDAPARLPQDAWARVLLRHVDERGRVDFDGLAADRADLDRFLVWVAEVGPASDPLLFPTRAHRLAYHLNAFNALMLRALLDPAVPARLDPVARAELLHVRIAKIAGRFLALREYRDEVIRPMRDPRVHFALNYMVRGGPQLAQRPYRAETLEEDLERDARRFFARADHLLVDRGGGRVWLSELQREFEDDFLVDSPSLIAYVNRYRDVPVPEDYALGWLELDWTVNRAAN